MRRVCTRMIQNWVELSGIPPVQAGDLEERFSPNLDIFHHDHPDEERERAKLRQLVGYILRKTVEQEINHCMVKLSRIAVTCTRRANTVRGIAAETFCVLDSWLVTVHSAEQGYVDRFREDALDAMQPDGMVSGCDQKRWVPLARPLQAAVEQRLRP